jgi:hypothetical protein
MVAFLTSGRGRVVSAAVHWVFTVLLIAVSVATVGFGGWLLRRLFTLEPGTPDTAEETEVSA